MDTKHEPNELEDRRRKRGTYRYAALVLDAFDRLEHKDRRDQRERKAEVEREARQRL